MIVIQYIHYWASRYGNFGPARKSEHFECFYFFNKLKVRVVYKKDNMPYDTNTCMLCLILQRDVEEWGLHEEGTVSSSVLTWRCLPDHFAFLKCCYDNEMIMKNYSCLVWSCLLRFGMFFVRGWGVISSAEIFIIIIRDWSLALLILDTGCFRAQKKNVAIAMES